LGLDALEKPLLCMCFSLNHDADANDRSDDRDSYHDAAAARKESDDRDNESKEGRQNKRCR
jgi:hypothetical protein